MTRGALGAGSQDTPPCPQLDASRPGGFYVCLNPLAVGEKVQF